MNPNQQQPEPTVTQVLDEIACRVLDIETMETRKSDRLDFHDVPVWSIREALAAAYRAGFAAGLGATPVHDKTLSIGCRVTCQVDESCGGIVKGFEDDGTIAIVLTDAGREEHLPVADLVAVAR